ncbi:hypothetical protein lerEdw1_016783 [Lerista edwardsae]|nr:hypothetical protein lerEdw1_016783 [Lerista edwardsae]
MYLSGIIGERLPIRYYLTGGMFASGLFTAMFGFGYFYNIHSLSFYIIAQIANGLVQTTGWPSVVTCIGNWFGKGRRGLIMGLWNSHTSVGNILGSLIAGYWVSTCWGLSFVVPGIIIFVMGIVCFLFLIERKCLGGILAGIISDRLKKRASTCGIMLLIAAPTLYLFSAISKMGFEATVVMLLICGALVNGPYALITTAVSADLGTHKSLKGNARALSTVTAIIDGTGSVGAALGPLLAGLLSPSGWNNVFYMLIVADACALLKAYGVVVHKCFVNVKEEVKKRQIYICICQPN